MNMANLGAVNMEFLLLIAIFVVVFVFMAVMFGAKLFEILTRWNNGGHTKPRQ